MVLSKLEVFRVCKFLSTPQVASAYGQATTMTSLPCRSTRTDTVLCLYIPKAWEARYFQATLPPPVLQARISDSFDNDILSRGTDTSPKSYPSREVHSGSERQTQTATDCACPCPLFQCCCGFQVTSPMLLLQSSLLVRPGVLRLLT